MYGHQGGKRWDELGDWDWHICTTMYKIDNSWLSTVYHRELCSVLCGDLNGKEIQKEKEEISVYVQLIDFAAQQKLPRSTVNQLYSNKFF